MLKRKHYNLVVPPKVNLETSSVDVDAPEGTSVILYCNVTGHPSPTITWSKRKAVEPKNSTNAVSEYCFSIRTEDKYKSYIIFFFILGTQLKLKLQKKIASKIFYYDHV